MTSGIFSIVTFILLIVCNFMLIHITDVQSSYGDTCSQNDTSNCTFPVLKCTPNETCDCYLGYVQTHSPTNEIICNMRVLSVPVTSTTVSPTTVTFRWDGNSPELGVTYDLDWTPPDGRVDYIEQEGGQVSGLHPDNQYNFTIVSDLSSEMYIPGGKFFGLNMPICTKSLYGGLCSTCGSCQDVQLVCTKAMDNNSRCLCDEDSFNLTDTGNCTSLTNILVTNITSTTSTSEIILHWTTTTELSSVIYKVEWTPTGGELVSVTDTEAIVSALSPAATYQFTITSILPMDAYYNERSVTSQKYSAKTQYPHVGKCLVYIIDECQDTTECIRAVDGIFRCMCGPTEYFSDTAGVCSQLEDLKVFNVSKSVTPYTVTFTWTTNQQNKLVNYTLKWTPNGGRLDNISNTGAHVSGLNSATLYNFTIISLLPSDDYYPEKNASVQVSSILTENDLEVTLLSASVSETTVTFTWTGSSLGSDADVDYNLQWTPSDGQKDFINYSGGRVSGLHSDSEYTFTIVSELFGESPVPERVCLGPNATICTSSFYGGQCSICALCENDQICIEALDYRERCLCNEQFFNLTDTGNCTSLNALLVTDITTTTTPTSANISWVANLQLSSVTYRIQIDSNVGQVDKVTSTGGQVSALTQGNLYYFSVASVVANNSYNAEIVYSTPLMSFWTDVPYLGLCAPPTSKECQEMMECNLANDNNYHCLCGDGYYFNKIIGACSSMDDLKVTYVSTTATATTVSFTWPSKQLPALGSYTIECNPDDGSIDNIGTTGALVTDLKSSTVYNFTIITHLPADNYYPERTISAQVPSVRTKSYFNETCDVEVGCEDSQRCLPVAGTHRCICLSTEYFDDLNKKCLSTSGLEVSLSSTEVSATSVAFNWAYNGDDTGVDFSIEWTPKGGEFDYADITGGQVSGLQPDTEYNFTIVTMFFVDSSVPAKYFYGPNITVCTKSRYGEECTKCSACAGILQNCVMALDNKARCLCQDSFFNMTKTGKCTSLNTLIVTNITTTRSTTSANITWLAKLDVSSVIYKIHVYPEFGEVDNVTRTGGQLRNLGSNSYYYIFVESYIPGNAYENEKNVFSSEIELYTEVLHYGYCDPRTNQECQEMTECSFAEDDIYRCMCNNTYYFNDTAEVCSSLDDLKVTDVSIITTASTVSFKWPAKQLPAYVSFTLEWAPSGGRLDNASYTGAQVSGLTSATLYNFTIISLLPSDHYYPDKRVSVQISQVMTKSLYGEQCRPNDICQDNHQTCSHALDNSIRCLCDDSFFNLTDTGNCTSLNQLTVTNITVTASSTSMNVTWVEGLQLSSVTYIIHMYSMEGHVDRVTSTGGQVSGLLPGNDYYFSVGSDLPRNSYQNDKIVYSQEVKFRTDMPYLGICGPDKECQEMTKCIQTTDNIFRCVCSAAFYFNTKLGACSSLEDLKVTNVSTRTTATTISFSWPAKQLPATCSLALECNPGGGILDNISSTGAHVSNLTTGTLYNCIIVTLLSADEYYQKKSVFLEISSVLTKNDYSVLLTTTSVSATTVTFLWEEGSPSPDVDYNFEWTPKDGNVDYINHGGGQVSGLQSDSQYNFTIISKVSGNSFIGPNVTICTKSLYGEECNTCGTCQDDQQDCFMTFDNDVRCLCEDSSFNLTETGNCTSLDELVVKNLTVTSSTSSANATWVTSVHVSSVIYKIQLYPQEGNVDGVTSTGGQVSNLSSGTFYYLFVDSILPKNVYYSEQIISSPEITFWTDVPYLGLCPPFSNKQCQDKTECNLAKDDNYRCTCDSAFYFNITMDVCSSLDDLKVTNVSARTKGTTVSFAWPAKQLPPTGIFKLEWTPSGGQLDNISNTGAHVSGLTSATVYNFTIISLLPSDAYYSEKSVSVQVYSVLIKPTVNQTCDQDVGCQENQFCKLNIAATFECQCDTVIAYYNTTSAQCLPRPSLNQQCDVSVGCQESYPCVGTPPVCQCRTSNDYFDSYSFQCLPLSSLAVSIITTTISATTVTFIWEQNNPDSGAQYDIQWTPHEGHLNYTNSEGGQVTGLQPGTEYNFTIVSIISDGPYYLDKKFLGPNVTLSTRTLQESSELNQSISVGARAGIGVVCVVLALIVIAGGVIVYKRRARTQHQEYSDQHYLADESHYNAEPSSEQVKDSSSSRPDHHRKTSQRRAKNMILENMSRSSQSPESSENQEVTEDSFDSRGASVVVLSVL